MTFDQVDALRQELRKVLQRPPWMRGNCTALDDKGYYIRINIDCAESRKHVPKSFRGCRIRTEVVGEIVALKG